MMMMYMLMSIMLSFLFFHFFNPLSLGFTLICLTIMLSLMLGSTMKSFWFMYLLMLIFIGGMLVLFIYVTTIFPNEKFSFNKIKMINLILILMFIVLLLITYNFFFKLNLNYNSFMLNFKCPENLFISPSLKMFSSQIKILMIFMVIYLLYCMIVVIKITNFIKGPLRKMN